jgi:hypothetical protein
LGGQNSYEMDFFLEEDIKMRVSRIKELPGKNPLENLLEKKTVKKKDLCLNLWWKESNNSKTSQNFFGRFYILINQIITLVMKDVSSDGQQRVYFIVLIYFILLRKINFPIFVHYIDLKRIEMDE